RTEAVSRCAKCEKTYLVPYLPDDRQRVRGVERPAWRSRAEARARVAVVRHVVARLPARDRVAECGRTRRDRRIARVRSVDDAAARGLRVEALQRSAD